MHCDFLLQALALAEQQRGFCAPNPAVGAVVVKGNRIIATGTHHGPGTPHAEVVALQQMSDDAAEAILYVTLEPCCHWGKTPPCTDSIIQSGIRKVVYAHQDPNPQVSGKGAACLIAAGITCEQIALPEIDDFYTHYHKWVSTQRPTITVKLAISKDGKIAGAQGKRVPITGAELGVFTQQKRKCADAILTTARTINLDNPQFNARLPEETYRKPIYIVDSKLQLHDDAQIYQTAAKLTVLHAPHASKQRREALMQRQVRCLEVPTTAMGLNIQAIVELLGRDGLHEVWVEAGAQFTSALLQSGCVSHAYLYVAPIFLGADAISADYQQFFQYASSYQWQCIGKDILYNIKF